MNVMLKFIYAIFIGVLFATLVGVGIAAFYPAPQSPDYPDSPRPARPDGTFTPAEQKKFDEQQAQYEQTYKAFEAKENEYSRNVSIVTLVTAIIALVFSLTLFKKLYVIADGVLIGGVLTLLYSIIRGFDTQDDKFRFVVVAVGFVVAIVLGYIKFVPKEKNK